MGGGGLAPEGQDEAEYPEKDLKKKTDEYLGL